MKYGVSERRIKNDEMFAQGLAKLSESLRKDILENRVKIGKKYIMKLSTFTIEDGSVNDLDALKLAIAFM
jgi:hypothetical protein